MSRRSRGPREEHRFGQMRVPGVDPPPPAKRIPARQPVVKDAPQPAPSKEQ